MTREHALQLRAKLVKASVSLSDEDALEAVELFDRWSAGVAYAADMRLRYSDKLYRCVQTHTSQAGWEPDKTPALWTVVSLDEWPEWVQPTGVQDAYALNAKVSHKGDHWTSDYDNNTWEPSVFGWSKVK